MEIWEQRDKGGNQFICQGKDQSNVCDRYDLGAVGDNEASSITCTCPREFDYVEYDIPTKNWVLTVDDNDGIEIDQVIVRNPCYTGGNCPDQSSVSTQAYFQKKSVGFIVYES